MTEHRLALLFSGEGTNAQVLAETFHDQTFHDAKTSIVLAISNKKDAAGIEKLSKLGIQTTLIDHTLYPTREAFDTELVKTLKAHTVSLTLLAGFMRILTPVFTDNIKALNIHPSLLPLHKGANAMEQSFNDNSDIAGVTIHYVSGELDSGNILAQEHLQKITGEDFQHFKARMHALEYHLYKKTVKKILNIK